MPITKILFSAPGLLAFSSKGVGDSPRRDSPQQINGSAEKYWTTLKNLAPLFSDLDGFVIASVKWRPKGKFLVNKNAAPAVLGTTENPLPFPVRGEPSLAESLAKLGEATGLWAETTEEWGLDPGHWHPLPFLVPKGPRFVVPISLSQMSPEAHRKWGVAVRRGTQKWPGPLGLLICGSLSHQTDLGPENATAGSAARQFDDEIVQSFTAGTPEKLEDMERALFKAAQPEGGWGSLYFLWGAAGENPRTALQYYERSAPGVGSTILFCHLDASGVAAGEAAKA